MAAFAAFWGCAVAPATEAAGNPPSHSEYTKVNDRNACQYQEAKGGDSEPGSCEFLCNGPIAEVKTKLLSCYDYEHLFFQVDGNWYSTWSAMTRIGGLSGLGNRNGLIEWVFDGEKPKTRRELQGLIVRFNGVDQDNKAKNALAVFSLRRGDICWKGNYVDNAAARAALREAKCQEPLNPEK